MNRVTLLGRLGAAPEIRRMNSGDPVATMRIATEDRWRDKQTGETRTATEWHNVVCFNDKLCDVIERHVQKGARVLVEGKLKTRKWQDREGADRYTTEVIIERFGGTLQIIDWPDRGDGAEPDRRDGAERSAQQAYEDTLDDDIPF